MGSVGEGNPSDAVLFVGISLVLGIASRHLLKGTRLPYTVALLLLGIAMGSLECGTRHRLGKIGDGIRIWANIDADLLLTVFLPPLLFESSSSMEVHQIKKCMAQMVILAGPGVLISTFIAGTALTVSLHTSFWAFYVWYTFWGWPRKGSETVKGYSCQAANIESETRPPRLLGGLLSATDPVAVVGLLKELGSNKKLSTLVEGESLMNDGVAIVVYTLFVRMITGSSFSWRTVIYFLATASLGAVGVGIAFGLVSYLWLGFIFNDTMIEVAMTLCVSYLAYFMSQEVAEISGVLTVTALGMFYALVARTAFNVEYSYLKVYLEVATFFNKRQSSDASRYITQETGTLFVFFTCGIVFLTLVVNGSTSSFVLRMLDMDKLSADKGRLMDFTKYEMMRKALEVFGDLVDDEELGPADWPTVKKYTRCLHDAEGECIHPHTASENVERMHLSDIRIRFLNGVQATYWVMLEEGRITQYAANILKQSIDGALDLVSAEPLCDWNGLKSDVQFPNHLKFLQTCTFPQKLVTYIIVERLESVCYISAAFLRAHRIARQQLHDFIGDSEIALAIINESEREGKETKKFLEQARITFPRVLRIFREKELVHLHDAIQTDLKKLLRNPTLVKIPKLHNLVSANPFLGALPSAVHEQIVGSTRETMKQRGMALYKEGSKPNGIWVISNGVVKWASKGIRYKHSLHPAFSHGTEKIHSVLGSDHAAVEDFLWQESSIILSKLLLPQIFEKMAMHELRTLVAERSTMSTLITGECFDLPQNMIGLLLEGIIKTQFLAAVSHGGDNSPRSTTREYISLMSWPERRTESRQHLEHPSGIDQHGNNFSARAMQLSLYGSMISDERHSPHTSSNVLRKPPKKPSLRVSRSYTGVSSTESRRLISEKSEGHYTVVNVGEISESLIAPRENSGTT
uniref:Sodium/hydrogen exchanger 8 isoform X2 n=1 Tax=Tanacetum cinerariifolium TaxID=118510 RepID=A0A6L2LT68_TANCI|nr:sodium/hydrogen exchanger 8 isoform X2 [Tanacetum cinerariifolium]